MADITNHVNLAITVDSSGISRAGFGTPMILSHTASWVERVRSYTSLSAVADDFATDSPEYLQATAVFAQNPHVTTIKIGRCALPATKKTTWQVLTALNGQDYTLVVKGEGVTATTCTHPSTSTTKSDITAAMKVLLDAVTGKNYTVTDDTVDTLTITGSAAGEWFTMEVDDDNLTLVRVEDTHADSGAATDLAAILVEDSDWYFIVNHFNSNAYALAVATWTESNGKLFVCDVQESAAVQTAAGNSDTLDDLATATRARTAGIWHPRGSEMVAAAWIGDTAWIDAGGETWKFRTLSGVTVTSLTSTQRGYLTARNANFYETVAGRNQMSEGTTADGDYIDVQRFIDWLQDDMSKGIFGALANAAKVPFTDPGVGVIVNQAWASLRRGIKRGGLAESPEPTVSAPKVADVSSTNKTARTLPDVTFSATLAGAIHKVNINGTVTV